MTNIEETGLPGVGVRHDFVTSAGRRIGMITHRTGHRKMLIYAADDPDACIDTVRLEEEDARALDELLGASRVTERGVNLRQSVEGFDHRLVASCADIGV